MRPLATPHQPANSKQRTELAQGPGRRDMRADKTASLPSMISPPPARLSANKHEAARRAGRLDATTRRHPGHPRPSSDPSPERGATPDRKARSISPDPRTAEGHPTTTKFGLPQAPNLPSGTCAVPERPARHPATSEQSLLRPRNPSRSEAPSHLRSPSEPLIILVPSFGLTTR